MKIKIVFLFFILICVFCDDNNCESFIDKNDCLSYSNKCLFAKNSFNSYENSNCIFFNEENDMKKFCDIFIKMNKKENFIIQNCESKNNNYLNN